MKITEITPYTVIERFPEHQIIIQHLFRDNPNFQTLCSDYRRCAKALRFWNMSDLCDAPQRREEYKTLLNELESEILQYIEKGTNWNSKNRVTGE